MKQISVLVLYLLLSNNIFSRELAVEPVEFAYKDIEFSTDKIFKSCYVFNGETSLIKVSRLKVDSSFSFSVWLKPYDLSQKNRVVLSVPGVLDVLTTTQREIEVNQKNIGVLRTENLNLSKDIWSHLLIKYKQNVYSVYVNGVHYQDLKAPKSINSFDETNTIYIGKNEWRQNFYGELVNPEFYTMDLDEAQIKFLYQKLIKDTPISNNALLHLSFNGNSKSNIGSYPDMKDYDVSYIEDKQRGRVAYFNGKSSYVDYGKLEIDNQLTISTWIKLYPNRKTDGAIASFGQAFAFRASRDNRIMFTVPQHADLFSDKHCLKNAEWQHVAVTYHQGRFIKMYLNGILKKTIHFNLIQDGWRNLKIGSDLWNFYVEAEMDDYIIWNRILTDGEINKVFRSTSDELEQLIPNQRKQRTISFTIIFIFSISVFLIIFVVLRRNKIRTDKLFLAKQKFLTSANLVIEENIQNSSFDVKEFTLKMGMSKTKLYNEFKQYSGLSISAYVRERRLIKACELLNEEDYSITEIVYQTGFESRSYFNKCFKKKYDITPSEYRKNLNVSSLEK
jgi:AraC-like DNA-binding protein